MIIGPIVTIVSTQLRVHARQGQRQGSSSRAPVRHQDGELPEIANKEWQMVKSGNKNHDWTELYLYVYVCIYICIYFSLSKKNDWTEFNCISPTEMMIYLISPPQMAPKQAEFDAPGISHMTNLHSKVKPTTRKAKCGMGICPAAMKFMQSFEEPLSSSMCLFVDNKAI